MLNILVERTASCVWSFGKVAAVVCIINAGSTQNAVVLSAIERHAGMSMRLEFELTVRAGESSARDRAIASWTSRHDGHDSIRIAERELQKCKAQRCKAETGMVKVS